MARKRIEDAIARVVKVSESKGFLVVVSIEDPLAPTELERLSATAEVRLSADYSEFLLSANGLEIGFYRNGGPEDGNPDFTFKLTGLEETIQGTLAWRNRAKKYLQEEEDPPTAVLAKPFRDLVYQVALINPFSWFFIHPDTGRVYTEDLRDLFGCGMLFKVADSFEGLLQRSFREMMREGYMPHL
jgi:hypothetical protein